MLGDLISGLSGAIIGEGGLMDPVQRLIYGNAAVDAPRLAREAKLARQGQVQQLIGAKGQQYQPGTGTAPLRNIAPSGYLGGQMDLGEMGARMMAIPGREEMGMKMLQQAQPKPQGPAISQLDPAKFTPQSLQQFAQTQDYSLLQPISPAQTMTIGELGVGGGRKQKALIDPSGQRPPQFLGSPYGEKGTGKITEGQGKAALYSSRADEANQILTSLQGAYSPAAIAAKTGSEGVWGIGGALGSIANVMMSPESQQAEQAQRNFINAILRQESGAVINPDEFSNAQKQYFPQTGDSPEVLKQKAQNRETAIRGLQKMAGPALQKTPYQGQQRNPTPMMTNTPIPQQGQMGINVSAPGPLGGPAQGQQPPWLDFQR
jgi:hypothetical protein